MAHELSIRANGKAEMAFVGETPWHGLGQSVTKGASIGVWAREAGMDWVAKEARVEYEPKMGPLIEKRRPVDSHKVIYRSDTGAPLGVVGDRYNIVQPIDVLELFREACEGGGWFIHTAGVLRGGKKLWAMASTGEVSNVISGRQAGKGDQILRNCLFATSLDGSMRSIVKDAQTVVVCANTLAVALGEASKGIVISHRSVFDAEWVKSQMDLTAGSFEVFMAKAHEMAETPIKLDEALEVLRGIFGQPAPKPTASVPAMSTAWMGNLKDLEEEPAAADESPVDEREARAVGRVLELFNGAGIGATKPGRVETKWGLFNAVTEYVDHEMGRTVDTRMDGAWFGRGAQAKQAAFEALAGVEE